MTEINTTEIRESKSRPSATVWSASGPWLVALLGFVLGIIGYSAIRNWNESQSITWSSRPASAARNTLSLIPEDDLGYAFQTLVQLPNVADARDFILSPSGRWLVLLNDRLNFYRNGAIPTAFTVDCPKQAGTAIIEHIDSVCWDPASSEDDCPTLFLGSRSGIVRYSVEKQLLESESGTERVNSETSDSSTADFITEGFTDRSTITCLLADESRIYAADAGKGEARIYDRKTGKCEAVLTPPEGRFSAPSPYMDLAIDASGIVWVADPGRHRIVPFKSDGTCLESLIWGVPGQDLPRFCGCCNPSHFLILSDGRFMTAEKKMPRVKIYSESGVWETAVAGEIQLEADPATIVQIAVAPDGWVYVLDPDKKRIIVFREK